jgi:hypothetical protein
MYLKSEQGSILFIILVAIVLFAALSFTVSNMLRGGERSPERERAQMSAYDILNQAKTMKDAVQYMRISNDCADTDISFETFSLTGYEHTPSADEKCRLFHPRGGGLSYLKVPEDWLDQTETGGVHYGQWFFSGENAVLGVGTSIPETGTCTTGTSCIDLIAFVPYLDRDVCQAINQLLELDGAIDPIFQQDNGPTRMNDKFNGTYGTLDQDIDGAPYAGQIAGCTQRTSGAGAGADAYFFYQVLLER